MRFTRSQITEIKLKFNALTSRELFTHLTVNFGLKTCYTSYRTALYEKGFYKCRMLRWTLEERQFLLDNYKTCGNIELAEKLSKKGRVFTKKNIEKKIVLEKISRSPEELAFIRNKAIVNGTYSKANFERWEGMKAKEREIRVWLNSAGNPIVMIKIAGTFVPYARQRYIELPGEVPKRCKVFFKDCNFLNWSDDNLMAKPSLNREERKRYKYHIEKYLLSQKGKDFTPVELPKKAVAEEPKINLISVRINDKLTVKVKPGTDVEKLKQRYNAHLSNVLSVSNFNPLTL